jgi:hypothetical protein
MILSRMLKKYIAKILMGLRGLADAFSYLGIATGEPVISVSGA